MNVCQYEKVDGLEGKKKVKRWSSKEMKNRPSSSLVEDIEEMIGWRTMEMNECWEKLAVKIEEEVLEKYKVEDSNNGAYRGRGSFLEWRRVRKSRKYRIRKW